MRRVRIALSLLAALGACASPDGDPILRPGPRGPAPPTPPPVAAPRAAARRLSTTELANTLEQLTGVRPSAALERLPPESAESFDRVVEDMTLGPSHLEAHLAVAEEVTDTLVSTETLDELVPACADDLLGPLRERRLVVTPGSALNGEPSLRFTPDPTEITQQWSLGASAPSVSLDPSFVAAGDYRLTFEVRLEAFVSEATISVDGVTVARETDLVGERTLTAVAPIAAGSHRVQLSLRTEPPDESLEVRFDALTIEGPLDPAAHLGPEREACADALLDTLGPRLLRRPLEADEREGLRGLFDEGHRASFAAGLRMMMAGLLASPDFVFLIERGHPVEGRADVRALDAFELAARLSYALSERAPDDALWADAETGLVHDPRVRSAHAARLLASDAGRRTVTRFFERWLWLDRLPRLNRDPGRFPDLDDEARAALQADARAWIWARIDRDASFSTLFDDAHDEPTRRGVIGLEGVLAATGSFDGTSPVRRGVFVLEQLLCEPLEPPPVGAALTPPPPDPALSARERWARHSEDPACASCHDAIDPVGFTLEGFDALGRARAAASVDTRGGVPTLGIPDGALDGAGELADALAGSERARRCFATQWLRFTLGRRESTVDEASLDALDAHLEGWTLRAALLSIVETEAFAQRISEAP